MTNSIILQSINEDGLKSLIKEAVREELASITPPPEKDVRYSTREATAKKLGVSMPSVDKAIDEGKLIAYRLNGRVLIKDSDIEDALTKIPTRKHRR